MNELRDLEKFRLEYRKYLKEKTNGGGFMPSMERFNGWVKRTAEQIIDEEEKKWAKSLRR